MKEPINKIEVRSCFACPCLYGHLAIQDGLHYVCCTEISRVREIVVPESVSDQPVYDWTKLRFIDCDCPLPMVGGDEGIRLCDTDKLDELSITKKLCFQHMQREIEEAKNKGGKNEII